MLNQPSASPINAEAFELLIEMIGPDEPAAILDLLDIYLADSTRQVNELQASFDARDLKTVHRIAHSMKSSSATFGALELSGYCEQLEHFVKHNCVEGDCGGLVTAVREEHARVVEALYVVRERFAG